MARGSTKNAANCASLCKMQITRTSTCRTHIAGPKPWRFGSRTSEGRYRLETNQYELGSTLLLSRVGHQFCSLLSLHASSSRARECLFSLARARRLVKYLSSKMKVSLRVSAAAAVREARLRSHAITIEKRNYSLWDASIRARALG